MTTLFSRVVPKFTPRLEDVAVESLGHVLTESAAAREALRLMLSLGGVEVGALGKVRTQPSGERGERPDLSVEDAHGTERVLIEAKFWAELTDNQPVSYLDRLRGKEPSALLFVVPMLRMETLWPAVCRLSREADYDVSPDLDSGDLRSAAVDGTGCCLMLTSWAALLNAMSAQSSGDPGVLADIQQLRGLTDQMDSEAFLPLRPEELAPWFARRMRQLPGLIDDATDRARELGWVNTERLARTPLTTGYGRYIQLAGVNARFDINFDYWAERGDTPLWLWLYNVNNLDEEAIGERLATYALEKTGAELSDDWVLPIILPTGVEYEDVLRAVVDTLVDVGRAINPDGQ